MINLFSYLSDLKKETSSLKKKGIIADFRIILKVNNEISLYILCEEEFELNFIQEAITSIYFVTPREKEADSYYQKVFSNKNLVELSSRKRLSNLLERDKTHDVKSCPIITFYSYKGGMGRSTTLASCAAYLANHQSMNIVIIDCDLEAPGFTNYYLNEPDEIIFHNGFVEYLLDFETSEEQPIISDYVWEVSKEFSGDGLIRIMPAGNLSDELIEGNDILETHRRQYLEGLARIDIASKYQTVSNFKSLIQNINLELKPDVIFIDSRTGFNDIFGLSAFQFSDIVVGFFGNNAQSTPGLKFFIDNLIDNDSSLTPLIVNSIISGNKYFRKFKKNVERYLEEIIEDDGLTIKMFPVKRNSILELTGTPDEDKEDFLDLIKSKDFSDYNQLFDYIYELLNFYSNAKANEEIKEVEDENTRYDSHEVEDENTRYDSHEVEDENTRYDSHEVEDENIQYDSHKVENLEFKKILSSPLNEFQQKIVKLTPYRSKDLQLVLKREILGKIINKLPGLYGENLDIDKEFSENRIFYRKSMEDIFNPDKLIIIGNKGTGKTYLYEVLKKPQVVDEIRKRANKNHVKYEIFHLVDKENNKYFDTVKLNSTEISDTDLFYERFWIVYIWNTIMLESSKRLNYVSPLVVSPVTNDTNTLIRFKGIINDDEKFLEVEQDLKALDEHLKKSNGNKNLIVIFDRLDEVVKPNLWSERIAPLIKFWRHHQFSKIAPKLFLRSDLFEKMSNITNVQQLKNTSISIEWNQEEIFGYFFKFVLSTVGREDFFKYMSFSYSVQRKLIRQLRTKSGKDFQLPLEEYHLKPLVIAFFGQYASMDNSPKYGESYEWFFKNLKNANDTISLRPFIDLIKISIRNADIDDKSNYPILPARYYAHGEARQTAVENHFNDLASETGNEDLKYIFNFIREKKGTLTVYQTLSKNEMRILLQEIIDKNSRILSNNSIDDLIYLLKVNGIISEQFISRGELIYSFALLFKYYLGLKTKRSNRGRR